MSNSRRFRKIGTPHRGFLKVETWDGGLSFPLEVVRASDSVVGLLVDETNQRVLLVRQRRAPMVRHDNPDGAIVELVAGRFDVKLGPKALLVKEALEEAGVTITQDDVKLVNDGQPMALSAGVLTERCWGAIAFIRPDQIAQGDESYGVAQEGESIVRVWMPIKQFIDLETQHDDWRVWAMAQFLARRDAETDLRWIRDNDQWD